MILVGFQAISLIWCPRWSPSALKTLPIVAMWQRQPRMRGSKSEDFTTPPPHHHKLR